MRKKIILLALIAGMVILTIFSLLIAKEIEKNKQQEKRIVEHKQKIVKPVNQEESENAQTKEEPKDFQNEPKQAEEIDTSDWKTYRNEEFGFEFKYPEDWYLVTNQKSVLIKNTKKELIIGGLLPEDMTDKTLQGSCFKVEIFENPLSLSIEHWVKSQPNIPKLSYKSILINNKIQAKLVKPLDGIFYGDPNIFILDKNYIYNIRFLTTNYEQHLTNLDIFNNFFRTFKLFN